jgi:hypothetical protein
MKVASKHQFERDAALRLAAVALLIGVVVVSNPELRALIIVVDALGLDLVCLLLAIQLRALLPIIRVAFMSACIWCCTTSFSALRGILCAVGASLPGRAAYGFSTLLLVLSTRLHCPLSAPRAAYQDR